MVYFVVALSPYSDVVYPKFLDEPRKEPFDDVKLVDDPDTLELTLLEREYIGQGRSGMGYGYPVRPELAPKKLLWAGGKKALPEAILTSFLAVSERFRALVEQYEPEVHQFIPVDIYKDKKSERVATYYWLNVCNRIDSVDADLSNYFALTDYAGGRGHWRAPREGEPRLVFSRKLIGNHHLWYDPFVRRGVFCSSQFGEAALAQEFLGLSLTPRAEG